MSNKAYYFVKNFNFQEVMNLIRYAHKNPETLTNIQKNTRLYRSSLRKIYALKLEGYKTDFSDFNQTIQECRMDFERVLNLPINSIEKQQIVHKWEKFQEQYFDPNMIIDESRPYAAAASRYFIWPDEQLNFDPFGYYKPRLVSQKHPEQNIPFLEDYPMNDTHWNYYETFSQDFDDAELEEANIKTLGTP